MVDEISLRESLAPSRYFAWRKSVEIGTELAEDHKEICELYENLWTLEGIAEELDVETDYGAK